MKKSLEHLPELKQHELRTMSVIFRNTMDEFVKHKQGSKREFRILKIILFGSHAKGTQVNDPENGYVSDYDILVVVNHDDAVEEDIIWQRAREEIDRKVTSAPLGLIVHSLHDVNERLQQGHYFFKDIREEGIEVFSAIPKELSLPGKLTEEEKKAIARKHYKQWIENAAGSLKVYRYTFAEFMIKEAAFNLHQATERLYACTLLTCTNYLPKSHNIEKLGKLCAQIDPEFKTILPLDSKFHRRSFRRLQRAYIEARYSEHYQITEDELDYLADEVLKLKGLVERVCLARIGE
ncbi:HEPN domain protein [Vibrio aerogenes CECT 7868]|uniref:HEPN domain protein n=1 Tax=Vibrio aerogenes CECT 7868 TaxID=1216006 RepID=A0A1M5ZUJ7_9VIBR|nr:HEPN domain-containing protein [Vibrio aerogenes]SHI27934.1 HEPN domain protein [Vibrio aerogenes CECT 7868]